MDERDRIERYQKAYVEDYGFEHVMVDARQRMLLERLRRHEPSRVIEIGGGSDLLHARAAREGLVFRRWVLVEPADLFIEKAAAYARKSPEFCLVRGFIEDKAEEAIAALGGPADFVIASGLLHEVADDRSFLGAVGKLLVAHTRLHVNVPNARSFHRRLAVAMGLIKAVEEPSERQTLLLQPRIYDREGLVAALEAGGLRVLETGGYLIKPFTHAQMEAIEPILTPQLLSGLGRLGEELADLASEIFAEAVLR